MRVKLTKAIGALLCAALLAATGAFAQSEPFAIQEIFFSQREGQLWLVGRMEPPDRPVSVAVYLVLPTELTLPEPGVYLYPVDPYGYFALPAGPLEEDGVIVAGYDIYVCDRANPPPNDYGEVRRAALAHVTFHKAGERYEQVLADAQPLPKEVEERLEVQTPMPSPDPTPALTPEPTPEATPGPTPTPEQGQMTEAMAERSVQVLLQTELDPTASAAYQAGINDLVRDKMLELAVVERLPNGKYQALITAPDFSKPASLIKYQGETPSSYMVMWLSQLRNAVLDLPDSGAMIMLTVPAEGTWSDRERDMFRTWLWGQTGMNTWLCQAIEQSGFYSALGRLFFAMPQEESGFARRFVRKEQAPLFHTGEVTYTRMARGSSGKGVEAAQQALIALGYMPEGSETGVFNRAMENAVKEFQRDNGLKQDGVLTPRTQAALFVESDGVTIKDMLVAGGVSQASLELWWPVFVRSVYNIEWRVEDWGMPILLYQTVSYDELSERVAAELIRAAEGGQLDAADLLDALRAKAIEIFGELERPVRMEMRLALPCESGITPTAFLEVLGSGWMEENYQLFMEAMQLTRLRVTQQMGW